MAALIFAASVVSIRAAVSAAIVEIAAGVIGFMGLSSLYDRIWGSTSRNLTRLSPCTVMVVK